MKKVFYQKQSAFTLIELLITIFVIGIIISLSTIYFSQVKKNNRDYKRLSDISEIQVALENYKFFEGRYPESISSSTSLIGSTTGITFLEKIPVSPEYGNDDCLITSYNYSYDEDNKIYGLNFCLEGKIENYTSGIKCSYPGGIKDGSCQALAFSGSLANGEVGVAYGPYTFTTSGGLAPYSFSVSSGTLPTGLSLNSSGVLSGTPTAAGNYTFNIQVTDSISNVFFKDFDVLITWDCGDFLVDVRDGKSYATKQYGSQCWMIQGLNIGTMKNVTNDQLNNSEIEKFCFNNNESYCSSDGGGLYQWKEAMNYDTSNSQGICPDGWHIPLTSEFNTFLSYVSSNYSGDFHNGKALAGNSGWNYYHISYAPGYNQTTNNSSMFNLYPAGQRSYTAFDNRGAMSFLWSSSIGDGKGCYLILGSSSQDGKMKTALNNSSIDYWAFLVRCIKNP
ncbi:MAG TPA: FISUMP domain-containing protein [bacterium]|nr:FISUMP domain-containing protein [bacterium]